MDAGGTDAPSVRSGDVSVDGEDLVLEDGDFGCILDWPMVRHFRITNLLGHLDEALAVANSPTGGVYPVGTVIQLIPTEVMVKRGAGFSPATNDWEFIALSVTASSTTVRSRGGVEAVGPLGSSCFGCHSLAAPQWDLVCEDTHGCDPLSFDLDTILRVQNSDPRCR